MRPPSALFCVLDLVREFGGVAKRRIFTPPMHAICADFKRQREIVVDEQGRTAGPSQLSYQVSFFSQYFCRGAFSTQLK